MEYLSPKKKQLKQYGEPSGGDEYEFILESDECPFCDELFKYEDKEYGGVAYYGIFYHTEYIEL